MSARADGKQKHDVRDLTTVSVGAAIEGRLVTEGNVRIDGAVCGGVETPGEVTIGPNGRVLGELRAERLRVAGRVDGIVHVSGHLLVESSGYVGGYARYETLEVEHGGVMNCSATLAREAALWTRDEDDE